MAKNSGSLRNSGNGAIGKMREIYNSFASSVPASMPYELSNSALERTEDKIREAMTNITGIFVTQPAEQAEATRLLRRLEAALDMAISEKQNRRGLPDGWTRDVNGALVSNISQTELPFMSPSRELQEAAGIADSRLSIDSAYGRISITGTNDADEAAEAIYTYLDAASSQKVIDNAVRNGYTSDELRTVLNKEINRLQRKYKK